MKFKSGSGWKACYDGKRNLYTAETWGMGTTELWEITGDVFSAVGAPGLSDSGSEELIRTGRRLYMSVNDRCGPPYTVILDDDYEKLCPWADAVPGDHVWGEELTDAAVELFASEKANREQRRKKREKRNQKKKKE